MTSAAAAEALENLRRKLPETPALGDATEAYKGKDDLAYAISQLPLGTRRDIKVLVIGAGFSGLAFAREVETGRLQNVSLTVYEKNASIGGTWYENRYPGYIHLYIHPNYHLECLLTHR